MVTRLLDLRNAVTLFHSRGGSIQLPDLTQWRLLESIKTLLTPFKQLTKDLSLRSSSASLHVPASTLLKGLLQKMPDDGVKSMKNALIAGVERRFESSETNMALSVATFLDPRFKDKAFTGGDTMAKVTSTLSVMCSGTSASSSEDTPSLPEHEAESSTKRQHIEPSQLSSLWDNFDSIIDDAPRPLVGIEAEIDAYRGEARIPMCLKSDPLDWWKANSSRFPLLAKAARRYLSAPATSVESERVFSTCGNVYDDRRTCLTAGHLENLVLLNVNIKLLNFEY